MGGASKVLLLQKERGAEYVLAKLKRGGPQQVLTPEHEVLAILKGEHKMFPPIKKKGGGGQKV